MHLTDTMRICAHLRQLYTCQNMITTRSQGTHQFKKALKDHKRFSSAQGVAGVAGDAFGCEFLQDNTVASDPPRHTQLRRAMAQPLFPRQLEAVKPRIEDEARVLITQLIKREQFDTPSES